MKGYPYVVRVARIYWVDGAGIETAVETKVARVMLELDWGEFGRSKVALHDENSTWYLYAGTN